MNNDEYKRLVILLEEIRETADKNYKILKKMRRDAVVGHIFRTIWFLIIFGVPIAVYFYYKPVIDAYTEKMHSMYEFIMEAEIPTR